MRTEPLKLEGWVQQRPLAVPCTQAAPGRCVFAVPPVNTAQRTQAATGATPGGNVVHAIPHLFRDGALGPGRVSGSSSGAPGMRSSGLRRRPDRGDRGRPAAGLRWHREEPVLTHGECDLRAARRRPWGCGVPCGRRRRSFN